MTRFAILLLALCSCSPKSGAELLKGTTKIELTTLNPPPAGGVRTLVIEDLSQVNEIIASITLAEKPPCACKHSQQANFYKGDGEVIQVSLCTHCFDVRRQGQVICFEMPPAFMKIFDAPMKE